MTFSVSCTSLALRYAITCALAVASLWGQAAPHYTFDAACTQAYEALIDLRLAEGRQLVAAIRADDPDNLIGVWLEDYADFFIVYVGVDEQEFEKLEDRYDDRLDQLEDLGPSDSPYHLYVQANMQLHWALARLKYGQYLATFGEARRAYKLLERNLELFPDFVLARREMGILQAAVATVPDNYQWGLELLSGMEGDLAAGKSNLQQAMVQLREEGSAFLGETTAIYAYFQLNLDRAPEGAWKSVQDAGFGESSSLLKRFVAANVAMRTGHNDAAVRILESRPQSSRYLPFPYLDFMLGACLQRRLDARAGVHLKTFVKARNNQGDFVKEAYQKLAWEAALAADAGDYLKYLREVKSKGSDVSGSDKNALREAERGVMPNADLLRARLLFDGGYYDRAASAIAAVNAERLRGEERIELPYRAARIAAERKQLDEATALYKQTVSIGRTSGAYFACKSAVELGALAEDAQQTEAARSYYELALDLDPDDYAAGLHQQARAGLARLK